MKRKTRKRNPFLNPPLKRRAIIVCPFKGAFGNSPAFSGWEEKFRRRAGWAKSEAQPAISYYEKCFRRKNQDIIEALAKFMNSIF